MVLKIQDKKKQSQTLTTPFIIFTQFYNWKLKFASDFMVNQQGSHFQRVYFSYIWKQKLKVAVYQMQWENHSDKTSI